MKLPNLLPKLVQSYPNNVLISNNSHRQLISRKNLLQRD